jgi:prepilin-type N-terminal cleavage/methylation domain-containing protein
MAKQVMKHPKRKPKLSSATGFSFPELLIVIAIIGIVSTFAVLSFQKSNKGFKLAGATRTLSTYLEKARVDSVRRHGGASININSLTSYTVNIDFGGTGTSTARTITLPQGTSLRYTLPPANTSIDPSTTPITIAYDYRGRVVGGTTVLLTLTDPTAGVGSSTVAVGQVGDVSTDTTVTGPVTTPAPQVTVDTTTGIKSMH